ncbi:SRR1-domain-containing protein [Lentinula raphanica]|nr:SRR1-domain-containing protein [Lentinula raphanica]
MTFTAEDDSNWLSSSSSSRRKLRKAHGHKQHHIPTLSARLQTIQNKLDSTWLNSCTQTLRTCLQDRVRTFSANVVGNDSDGYTVTCLGLGSPETSDNARVQLAFLLTACDALHINHKNVSIYDPIFTNEDKSLFVQLGIQVLEYEHSDSPLESHLPLPTPETQTGISILFMPHCDLTLYESVLAARWSPERLRNVVFVGNHFDDYIQNNSVQSLERKAPHLLKIAPNLTAIPLPPSPDWPGAFNNTSVQYLTDEKLAALFKHVDEDKEH